MHEIVLHIAPEQFLELTRTAAQDGCSLEQLILRRCYRTLSLAAGKKNFTVGSKVEHRGTGARSTLLYRKMFAKGVYAWQIRHEDGTEAGVSVQDLRQFFRRLD